MINTVVLDCDGVLLESVSIKTEAFRKLFSFVPEHVDEIARFHIENGGMSRFDKFRYIYRNILNQKLSDEQFRFLSDRFSGLVFDGVVHAPFVSGAEEFLELFHKKIPLYIVSATPENELLDIINARHMNKYFRGIYGSPKSKADHLNSIITAGGIQKDTAVYVGDARNDCEAAGKSGIRFIGRVPPGCTASVFSDCPAVEKTVSDLHDLAAYLEPILC